jgi:hypothetical protein
MWGVGHVPSRVLGEVCHVGSPVCSGLTVSKNVDEVVDDVAVVVGEVVVVVGNVVEVIGDVVIGGVFE